MDEEPAPKNECESPSKKEGKKKSRPKSSKSAKGRESRQSQEKEGIGGSPKKQSKEKSQENRLKRENSKNRRRHAKSEGTDDAKPLDKKSNSAKTKPKKIVSYSREELLKLRDCDLAQKWPVSLDPKYARGFRKLWKPLACFDERESEPDEGPIEKEAPKRYNERRYGTGRVISCNSESDYMNLYDDTSISRIRTPEKAPEWFTNAPTSQNDVIELKGFDDDEEVSEEKDDKPASPMQDDSAISSVLKPGNQPPKQPMCNGFFPPNVESMSQALKSALGMKNGGKEVDQHFDSNMLNMDMSHLMENENVASRAHQWFAPENEEREQYVEMNGERSPIGQTFPGLPDKDPEYIRQWMSQAANENSGMDFATFEKLVLSNNTKTPTAAAGQEIMMEVLKQQHANQLIRMIQQQRQKQVMSVGALGIKSPLAAMQFPCQSPALTLLKQQSSSPRAPSPIMFGNQPPMHLNAPVPIRPQPQTPNPDYLTYHTQAIMQNALLKRQMEGQKNFLNKQKLEERKPLRVPFVPTAVMKNLNISTNKENEGGCNSVTPPKSLDLTPESAEDRGAATGVGGNLLSPASSSSSSGGNITITMPGPYKIKSPADNQHERLIKKELEEQEMMREYQMRQRQMRLIDEQLRIYGENSKVGRDVIAIEVQRMQLNEHLNSTTGSPLGRPVLGSGSSISKVQNEQENNNFADLSMFFEPNVLQQALTKMPPIPAHNVVSVNELERH